MAHVENQTVRSGKLFPRRAARSGAADNRGNPGYDRTCRSGVAGVGCDAVNNKKKACFLDLNNIYLTIP